MELQISIDFKVMAGEARYAICEGANRLAADLVVVGSHGHGSVKRWAMAGCVDFEYRNI